MAVQLLPSLNAGELSPRLESRPDLEKYGSGCRTLENFLIMPYGGVNRRPGLEYLGAAKLAGKKARLIGFNFSTSTNFVIELGEGYLRFWSNGLQVAKSTAAAWATATVYAAGAYVLQASVLYYCLAAHTAGTFATDLAAGKWVAQSILEVPSPYVEADIFDLQYVQINDVMYITHPGYAVRKLSRLADDDWTLAAVDWEYPPMRDENITATTLTASAISGTGITVTASTATFQPSDVGGYYEITHKRSSATIQTNINGVGNSSSLRVVGAWEFRTTGTWNATVVIQRSRDNAIWETARTYSAQGDRNISTNGVEEKEVYLRIRIDVFSSGSSAKAYLDATDSTVFGVVKVTGYTDSTHVTGDVVKGLDSTNPTEFWSEGAWSTRRGFPRTVVLHEQRLMFGGNAAQAQTVWGSAVNEFETFRRLSYDDSAITFTIASQETNAINWMISQQVLEIGTAGYEYVVSASNADAALTPTNIQVKPQSHFGSKYARAVLANEVTLFIQRQGRKVREFVYQFEKDGYVSADLTLLADHVTEGGIVQIAFQQQPDAILWVVTGAGSLAGMTYERGQNVVGWHRHSTDGAFESVASIYGHGGSDEVWCLVQRTIGGNVVRYVERFDPDYRETLEEEDKENWFYLDAARKYVGAPATVIPGLGHLEGKTVDILADGAVVPPLTVAGGQITLTTAASTVVAGLGYTSLVKPMPLDPGQLPDGSAQGRRFRINRVVARIYKSLGGEFESAEGVWDPIYFRDTASPMNRSPEVFTGDKERMVARTYEAKATIQLRQRQPLPLTILGFVAKYDVYGD